MVHWWGGYGAIVVDTTRNDQNRFGLVVFESTEPTKQDEVALLEPRWYQQGVDLSSTGLEQASGDRFVVTYLEDGTRNVCDLQWDRKRDHYVCR